ncbi:hypothetical protein DMC30DRAFT_416372 [Rhodotorula diobovata]|uniref:Uncharacterized protein n=1 Tax=Rhodotorula diobovata TaxID=5288 RepID=A0A5C5FW99_9BASI|nr:hypothetical protein DMC30DRAFT_416372 [Rhodotorula diobovata]
MLPPQPVLNSVSVLSAIILQHGIPLPATSTSASVGTLLRRISSAVSPSGTWDQAILRDLTEDRFREQTAYGQKVLEQVLMAIETSKH